MLSDAFVQISVEARASIFRMNRMHLFHRSGFLSLAAAVLAGNIYAADPFAENVRTTEPQTPEEELKAFQVPNGFEMQLVAAEPDLRKPMNMAFDAKGRLWITESREYPFPVPLDKPARDTIRIYEDFDATGRARKVTIFAEGLNIPIGIYPYGNGCIAWSIPNIWYFQDTDGDGKADKKELLYGPFGWERDTHGNQASFRRGFDGWLYATHGYNNNSSVRARDGSEVRMNSGNTYRFALDGGHIEQHTYGQVNPFGLCFDPAGHMYSADCHSAPIYQLIPGAFYPSFGKPDDGLGFAPVLMQHSHGSTAIAGIVYVADDLWPDELQNDIFIGNVMTSRINHDHLTHIGSSPRATEAPDFLATTDPWFRPVDIQLAPDGALYIADFYNRIIGHYEVPLQHPGRDRERGRIWRLVPKGKPLRPLALKGTDAASLIEEMGSPSFTRRMLAMNTLVDTLGSGAANELAAALNDAAPAKKVHLLWALHRIGKLTFEQLGAAARSSDTDLHAHALKILAETPNWTEEQRALVHAGLSDANPDLERAAAEAAGARPNMANVAPLLALLERTPQNDDHLRHTARVALRNQLREPAAWTAVQKTTLPESSVQTLVSIATGIPAPEAAEFLVDHLDKLPTDKEGQQRALRHVARYAPAQKADKLADFVQERSRNDIDLQLSILDSVQQGFAQRGLEPSISVQRWAIKLAGEVLDENPAWTATPLEGARPGKNPWFLQSRKSADGAQAMFLCSLPPGGEGLTGVLRTRAFDVPSKLSFYVAGHDGYPDKPAQKKNVIRLLDEKTREVLAESYPPRNDTAQKISWDLSKATGRRAYIEVVDADTGDAYAWLAVGRFDPDVAPMPRIDPSQLGSRQKAAGELASKFKGIALKPKLEAALLRSGADVEAMPAMANALLTFKQDDVLASLIPALSEPTLAANLRARLAKGIVERNDTDALLVDVLKEAPFRVQTKIAQSLAGSQAGAEKLLKLVEENRASARLLLDRTTADKFAALKTAGAAERVKKLTANLSQNEAAQKLIEQRRAEYKPGPDDARLGEAIWAQNCSVCHRIGSVGNVVGPQLDGIGNRGLERLLEDVLDPNRNVDRAFRTHIILLKDGDVISGLPRREEGAVLVLADSTGKETSIPKANIQSRRESETSLMPENFGDVIPPADFQKLMAFLLSKRKD